jgi:hypothetical protein
MAPANATSAPSLRHDDGGDVGGVALAVRLVLESR